ncbi:MAG: tyrosine-type recombinase/integrase [Bacteroidia bacterium]
MKRVLSKASIGNSKSDFEYIVDLIPFYHKGNHQIGIKPSKYGAPYEKVKSLGAKYTITHRYYYLENTPQNLNKIFNAFKDKAWVDMSLLQEKKLRAKLDNELKKRPAIQLNAGHKQELKKFYNYLMARRLAESTIKTYCNMVRAFLGYFNSVDVRNIDDEMVKAFLAEDVKSRGYSNSTQRQMISAIKLFYRERVDHKLEIEKLPKVKKDRQLPKLLSMREVELILDATPNIKHKTLLSLCYACGLRIGEALNLRLGDVNKERMMLEIRQAKGSKDRYVPISENILQELREYYKACKPSVYLFEGSKKGQPYTAISANSVLKASAKRAGLTQNVHMHMLRHSYATHLHEFGTDIFRIQKLMGHKSPKTTEIYTFVSNDSLSNITSPFDRLRRGDKSDKPVDIPSKKSDNH